MYPNIGKYYLASSSIPEDGNLGTAIYVHNKIFHDKITINSAELQISAIKLQLKKKIVPLLYITYITNQVKIMT